MRYLVVVERTASGFSAYSPDLAGCVATGASRAEVERAMHEAITFHMDGLRNEGSGAPVPNSYATYVEIAS